MYSKAANEVLKEAGSFRFGLLESEASLRLEKCGKNVLDEHKRISLLKRIFVQAVNPMFLLLLAAGLISLAMGLSGHGGSGEYFEAAVIFLIVFINVFVGIFQEGKAEKALEALSKMSEPFCKVYRGAVPAKIKTSEVVRGDVVILEAGDIVPADGRILWEARLRVEESALTGESTAVKKHSNVLSGDNLPLGDRKNMVFAGSLVSYGRCEYVVTATGMNTELGKIAGLLASSKKEQTNLQKKLNQVGRVITCAVIFIAVIVYIAMAFMGDAKNAFMTAVVLAVAAIPEGLPAVVTIVMSFGVSRLSKKNAIVKRLTAVETLGCTQVICSDKTGTLTLNQMTVKQVATVQDNDNKALEMSLRCMVLCNDSKFVKTNGSEAEFIGDPTETALVKYAIKNNVNKSSLDSVYPRVDEIPFDSARKMMSVACREGSSATVYTKGALDEVLNKCTHVFMNGEKLELTGAIKKEIVDRGDRMSSEALRVIGFAFKQGAMTEDGLTFTGLCGMIDPPRPEVFESVKTCREAGIKVVMITGDHKNTALAIAKQIGIWDGNAQSAITGQELDRLSDEQFEKRVEDICVYARVSPENKVRIVKALKKRGLIVAMTGDGVNDAPSLKNAHIGIGMGIAGTDVTKNAADIVLADDNFATIETAVKEGRKIYANIQKAISFLLSSNMCEVLSLFIVIAVALITGNTSLVFLAPAHLLWVNLVTDTFPSLAFSSCEPDEDIMKTPPRQDNNKNMFKSRLGVDILVGGILQTIIVLTVFFSALSLYGNIIATTMAVITLNFIQLVHSFNVQARGSIFKTNILKNKPLIYAFFLGALLTLSIVYIPGINTLFGLKPLNARELFMALSFSFAIVPMYEIYKGLTYKKKYGIN